MTLPWILGVCQFFAEILVEQIIVNNAVEYVRAERVRKKIILKIQETLEDVIGSFPDGKYIFENFDLENYLADGVVRREIGNLVSLDKVQPDLELLKNKWVDMLGGQHKGNYQLIITKFIQTLREKLWEIEEISERLHLKEQRYTSELIENYLPSVSRKIDVVLASLPSKDETDTSNFVLQGQIDVCKSLLKSGFSLSALNQLLRLEEEYQNQPISNSLKSKLQGLIGACLLDIGREEEAIDRFERSYQITPENPEAMANYALAKLLREELDLAIQQASLVLSVKPIGTNARSVRLEAQARKQKFEKLSLLIEEEFLHDNNYVRALGLILSRNPDNFELSEKYLRMSWAQMPGDMYIGLTLSSLLIKKQIGDRFPFGFNIIGSVEFKNKIDEALKIIDVVSRNVESGDNIKRRINVIAARAGAKAMCDDFAGAKEDCDEVLKLDPTYELGLHNRGLIALVEEDYELAVSNLSRLNREYIFSENLVLALARAYIGAGKANDALELIDQAERVLDPKQKILYEVMKALAFIKNGDISKAIEIKSCLVSASEDSYEHFEAAGSIDLFLKNYEEALKNFSSGLSHAVLDVDKKRIGFSIANVLYNLRQFDAAVEQFEKLGIDFSTNLELARLYVSATYAVREYGKAYKVAGQLRSKGIIDIFLIEIEAWISEFLGDLPNALSLIRLQATLKPAEITYQVNIARLEFRLDNLAGAIKILEEIDLDSVGAFELMQVSEMFAFMQQYDKAIKVAYNAYRKGGGVAEIHRAYLSLFLRIENKVDLRREVIGADTAVLLEDERQSRWIKILSVFPPKEAMEYSLESDVSKLLFGHKVGNIINYSDSAFQKTEFVVMEIQSLFVRAFQEILEDYGLRFPGDTGVQAFNIKDDDYSSFFLAIAKMGVYTEKIHDFFKIGAITVEKYCKVTGRNQVLVFKALQAFSGERIISSVGTHADQQLQNDLVNASDKITLCLSSLLTFDYLDCLDLLPIRFEKLFVSQRLLDELEKTSYDLDRELTVGGKSIGYHGGRFFMSETPKEEVIENRDSVVRLIEFIKRFTEVVPVKPELANYLTETDNSEMIFVGDVSNSSILVAKTTNTVLLCDELVMAKFARVKYGVFSFWSQPLFENLNAREIISKSKYADICCKLLSADYYFTAINPEVINTVLLDDAFQSSKRFDKLLSGLRGPDTLEDDAVRIAALVTKFLYFKAPSREQKRFILDRLLNTLITGRIKDRVLTKLQVFVNREFPLAPVQENEFNSDFNLWRKVNHRPDELLWFPRL